MRHKSREEMQYLVNPRPDLTEGADLWARLLLKAYPLDGDNPKGLFWALHGLRCLGASLRVGKSTLLLGRGQIEEAEYARLRAQYLVPHAAALTRLLAELASTLALEMGKTA